MRTIKGVSVQEVFNKINKLEPGTEFSFLGQKFVFSDSDDYMEKEEGLDLVFNLKGCIDTDYTIKRLQTYEGYKYIFNARYCRVKNSSGSQFHFEIDFYGTESFKDAWTIFIDELREQVNETISDLCKLM